jgi:hypothetical protein
MNAGFHIIEDILKAFETGTEQNLIEKFSKRYSSDLELQNIARLYQEYAKNSDLEKKGQTENRLKALLEARRFEKADVKELHLRDRRNLETKMFYKHEEE